jgi:hypothetical protein
MLQGGEGEEIGFGVHLDDDKPFRLQRGVF